MMPDPPSSLGEEAKELWPGVFNEPGLPTRADTDPFGVLAGTTAIPPVFGGSARADEFARDRRGYVEGARPVATARAVSNSLAGIRTTPVSKSALAFSAASICDSTAFIGTGGSHSST